jgi:hypothetical protein
MFIAFRYQGKYTKLLDEMNALLMLYVEQVNNTQIGTAKKQVKSTS